MKQRHTYSQSLPSNSTTKRHTFLLAGMCDVDEGPLPELELREALNISCAAGAPPLLTLLAACWVADLQGPNLYFNPM